MCIIVHTCVYTHTCSMYIIYVSMYSMYTVLYIHVVLLYNYMYIHMYIRTYVCMYMYVRIQLVVIHSHIHVRRLYVHTCTKYLYIICDYIQYLRKLGIYRKFYFLILAKSILNCWFHFFNGQLFHRVLTH